MIAAVSFLAEEEGVESKCSPVWQGHVTGEEQSGMMPRGKMTSHGDKTGNLKVDSKCLSFNGSLLPEAVGTRA